MRENVGGQIVRVALCVVIDQVLRRQEIAAIAETAEHRQQNSDDFLAGGREGVKHARDLLRRWRLRRLQRVGFEVDVVSIHQRVVGASELLG
jgi:hypothetical protein